MSSKHCKEESPEETSQAVTTKMQAFPNLRAFIPVITTTMEAISGLIFAAIPKPFWPDYQYTYCVC